MNNPLMNMKLEYDEDAEALNMEEYNWLRDEVADVLPSFIDSGTCSSQVKVDMSDIFISSDVKVEPVVTSSLEVLNDLGLAMEGVTLAGSGAIPKKSPKKKRSPKKIAVKKSDNRKIPSGT